MMIKRTGLMPAFMLAAVATFSFAGSSLSAQSDHPQRNCSNIDTSEPAGWEKLNFGAIVEVASGKKVDLDELVDQVSQKRIVYLGDPHDNFAARVVQAKMIQALAQKYPGKVAIGMEMFRDSYQPVLDQWHECRIPYDTMTEVFKDTWGFDSELYRPLLDVIERNNIEVIGLRPSIDMEWKFDRGLGDDYPDMNQDDALHREYNMQILRQLTGAHGHEATDDTILERFYQKQLLRDAQMGKLAADFIAAPGNEDKILVVVAGSAHVQYGLGIPKRAAKHAKDAADFAIILPTSDDMSDEIDRVSNNRNPEIPSVGGYVWYVPKIDLDFLEPFKVRRLQREQQKAAPHPAPGV